MKRIFRFILVTVLILALLAGASVFAAEEVDEKPLPTGRGCRSGYFALNGVLYSYIASVGASTERGIYSVLSVLDDVAVDRCHESLQAVFITSQSGYRPTLGGYNKVLGAVGVSTSYPLAYCAGMEYVIGYYHVRTEIHIYGDEVYTIEVGF